MRDLLEAAVVVGLTTDYDCCCTHDDIKGDEEHVANAILADPAFRAALAKSIAEALQAEYGDTFGRATWEDEAEAIVARMLND